MFANDSVKSQNNTQAIDVGNNTLISARVTDYKPAAVPALDAIKDVVRQKVVAEQAAELAKKDGAAKLAELQKSKSVDGFAAAQKVSRTQSQGLTPAALSAVYKVDAKTLPAYVGVDLGADGYAIYRVNAVIPVRRSIRSNWPPRSSRWRRSTRRAKAKRIWPRYVTARR